MLNWKPFNTLTNWFSLGATADQIVNSLPSGLFVVNYNGNIETSNSNARKILNFSQEELQGVQISYFFPSWKAYRPEKESTSFDSQLDETAPIYSVMLTPTESRTGDIGYLVTFEDVTTSRAAAQVQSKRIANLRLIEDITQVFNNSGSEQVLIEELVKLLYSSMRAYHVVVGFADEENRTMTTQTSFMQGKFLHPSRFVTMDYGESIVGTVAETRQPLLVPDVSKLEGYINHYHFTQSQLSVPIQTGRSLYGVITLESVSPNAFTKDDQTVLTLVATRLALAMERTRAYEADVQAQQDAYNMQSMLTRITANSVRSDFYPRLLAQVSEIVNFQSANISLRNDDAWQSVASYGEPAIETLALSWQDLFGEVEDSLVIASHVDPNLGQRRLLIPLVASDEVVGNIQVLFHDDAPVAVETLDTIALFSNQAAVAIQNNFLRSDAQRSIAYLGKLADFSLALRTVDTTKGVLDRSVDTLTQEFQLDIAAILLPNKDNHLQYSRATGLLAPLLNQVQTKDFTLVGQVFNAGGVQRLNSAQVSAHDVFEAQLDHSQERSIMIGALESGGRSIGVVLAEKFGANCFDEGHLELFGGFAETMGQALDRVQLIEGLEDRVIRRSDELMAANVRLRELDQLKSRFVSNITQELAVPIANLDHTLDEYVASAVEEREAPYMTLNQELTHLEKLIESVLEISRLDVLRSRIDREAIDLNALVSEVLDARQQEIARQSVQIETDFGVDLPLLQLDREQTTQAIMNLVNNGLKFAPNSTLVLKTQHHPEKDTVSLTIQDQGIGISADVMPKIFDRFYRANTAQSGIGLGLAIVSDVLQTHSATIDVSSTEGVGTTVVVNWPISTPN